MKILSQIVDFINRLVIPDYDRRLKSAKVTHKMLLESTKGSLNHFYNHEGVKIRGFHDPVIKWKYEHPLVEKYKR